MDAETEQPTRSDETAFTAWVAPHLSALKAVAIRGVGRDDAADVVQEMLVRAWRRWSTFSSDRGTPRAWLMAILFDRMRRHRLRSFTDLSVADVAMISDADVERQLREWGERSRTDADGLVLVDQPLTTADRPRGRLLPVLVAVLVVALAAVGIVLLGGSGQHGSAPAHQPASTSTPTPVSTLTQPPFDALVVRDGDTVALRTRVDAVKGESDIEACDPFVLSTLPHSDLTGCLDDSITIKGVDLSRLSSRTARGGSVTGVGSFTALYRDGQLTVITQGRPSEPAVPEYDDAFCPTPAGGWTAGETTTVLPPVGAYKRAHPGAIVYAGKLQPVAHRTIAYVLTAGDPAPVRAALSAALPNRVCVIRSRYSSAQIEHAIAVVATIANGAGYGTGVGSDGQLVVATTQPMVTQQVADVLDRLPAGIVHLDVWITPVH